MEFSADVHSDPSRQKLLKEMTERFPPTEDFGPRKVIRDGKSEFMPATAGYADIVGENPDHRDLLHRIGFSSYICVPMLGSERVLGVISMAITDSGRRFTEADLDLAEVWRPAPRWRLRMPAFIAKLATNCSAVRFSSRNSRRTAQSALRDRECRSGARYRAARHRSRDQVARHHETADFTTHATG